MLPDLSFNYGKLCQRKQNDQLVFFTRCSFIEHNDLSHVILDLKLKDYGDETPNES